MSTEKENRYASGFTKEERTRLRAALDEFASRVAKDYGHPVEAVVQEVRYWQQSSSVGRTNPTAKEKKESFAHWQQRCIVCNKAIESIAAATFHHEKRGIPKLHSPQNMKPLHRDEDKGCHEKLHNAPPGSFTAGSLRKKR